MHPGTLGSAPVLNQNLNRSYKPKPSKSATRSGQTRAKTYDGKGLADFVYKTVYDVIQINGNRVVIGKGKAVTAAIKAQDLILL